MGEEGRGKIGISSFALHLLAMALMLCDHLWASVVPIDALTWLGRIAFPIFAFMIAEGYRHTKNLKKYLLRLLGCALIAEIPFNLFYSGRWLYPFHQNVLWTFLLSLLCIHAIERVRQRGTWWLTLLTAIGVSLGGYLLGFLTMIDYYGYGVLTVIGFYLLRGRRWYCLLGQTVILWWINCELMGGLTVPITLAGHALEIPQQGMALWAMVPILLYNGKRGPHNRLIQYSFYLFYPLHLLLLVILSHLP